MSISISELIKNNNLKLDSYNLINEQHFDFFSRISNEINGKKCVFILDKKYLRKIDDSVVMIITTDEIYAGIEKKENIGFCLTKNPRGMYFRLLETYEKQAEKLIASTIVGKNCKIAKTAVISEKGVVIGNNVYIGENVIIKQNVIIGDNVKIQSGTIIGEDDFNIYSYANEQIQLKHYGRVIIGNNVLIGSNCNIGQALYNYGKTIIGDNTQIGALTCIGHNDIISENCEICGGTVIGGYTNIGESSFVGMHSVIKNALVIGKNVKIGMGSVVVRNIKAEKNVFGNPAAEV